MTQMAADIEQFRLPRFREIPDVGLYLDQTVKYINRFLSPLGMEITASMISNYVKKGYIPSPLRKQYNAEQIARLFFLSIAKQVISMENIARLFTMQKKTYQNDIAYNYFCTELENTLAFTFELTDHIQDTATTDTPAQRLLRSAIVAVAHTIYLNDQLEKISITEQ